MKNWVLLAVFLATAALVGVVFSGGSSRAKKWLAVALLLGAGCFVLALLLSALIGRTQQYSRWPRAQSIVERYEDESHGSGKSLTFSRYRYYRYQAGVAKGPDIVQPWTVHDLPVGASVEIAVDPADSSSGLCVSDVWHVPNLFPDLVMLVVFFGGACLVVVRS